MRQIKKTYFIYKQNDVGTEHKEIIRRDQNKVDLIK